MSRRPSSCGSAALLVLLATLAACIGERSQPIASDLDTGALEPDIQDGEQPDGTDDAPEGDTVDDTTEDAPKKDGEVSVVPCVGDSDCPAPTRPCLDAVCIDALCDTKPAAPGVGCVAEGGASDACDGLSYHRVDACDGEGHCIEGGVAACATGNPCVTGQCTVGLGCGTAPAAAGSPCSADGQSDSCDGATWHAQDVCDGAGACVDAGRVDCLSDDLCVVAGCAAGGCTMTPAALGTPCRSGPLSGVCDGLSWSPFDACDGAGVCVDGGEQSCDAGDSCRDAVCIPGVGCSVTPAPAGRPCKAGTLSGACDGATWHTPDRCNAVGQCVDGATQLCSGLSDCRIGKCVAVTGCETTFAHAGTPCTFDGMSGVCAGDVWHAPDTCDGAGLCADGARAQCPAEPCLDACWDGFDPTAAGCSDGTREGFVDRSVYPDIASCGGAWTEPGVYITTPACGRQGGNDGLNADGNGCNAQDLCAIGWSICDDLAQITAYTGAAGCAHAVAPDYPNFGTGTFGEDPTGTPIPASPGGAFFVAAISGEGNGDCKVTPTFHDDAFGCGNLGRETKASCRPLNRTSSDVCSGLHAYIWPNGFDRDNPASDFGYDTAADWSWWCGVEATSKREPDVITKSDPDRQGGVLCCRD